ncbi:hypothetical protein GCM10010302_29370 [Streptomyces polychromogenes]|uniref:DUF3887 domain-containing protein n=1 Tax=Streptomyces polychromogenes TaxID=67342 RepID=A0ABN0VCZ4_9ACTN
MTPVPRRNGFVRTTAVAALAAAALLGAAHASPAVARDAFPVVALRVGPSYGQTALDTLAEVVRGDFAAVSARFAPALRSQASPEVLARSWAAYQGEFGRYVSHGDPRQVDAGVGTVVNVPLKMAAKPGEFRVTFDDGGRLIGLYFLRTGVPVA